MKDRVDERLDQLFAATRAERLDTSVLEEHFETRLLARISELRSAAPPWYSLAWRLAPAFAAFAVAITIATFTFAPPSSSDIFAAITADQDEVADSSYLIGE
jgi:hypothetical protein